jgi:hypothetical protein
MRRADHLSRGILPRVMCLSVILKPRQRGGPGPLWAVAPWKTNQVKTTVWGIRICLDWAFLGGKRNHGLVQSEVAVRYELFLTDTNRILSKSFE